ncbi:hypothetical protein Enr10x_52760 [Gimesia panareensis]|uniref:Uncharacterized protein n=1 Tax=Gimesia panareensis TaxID=2527978 RepID=A0A517QE57_9PLAN|nr:hypothetical protein [Gimesia panareensis]QDT29918.1 hypothetical protein Enr10x_52760 [Gimesia panareensis]
MKKRLSIATGEINLMPAKSTLAAGSAGEVDIKKQASHSNDRAEPNERKT